VNWFQNGQVLAEGPAKNQRDFAPDLDIFMVFNKRQTNLITFCKNGFRVLDLA
jgi:hypothetical protein